MSNQGLNSELLTIRETASLMRCSKAHVSNLVKGRVSGVLPLASIRAGRRRLIRRRSLEQWMEAMERTQNQA